MQPVVSAILAAIFGLAALFGVEIPEEVKAVVSENVLAIVSALLALGVAVPKIKSAIANRKKKEPDEHADVGNQRGFAHKGLLAIVALASVIALTAGCASIQKELPPDVRAAAVMRDAKAVAETCLELYEADRLPPQGAAVCLQYVDQAITMASAVHFLLATAPPSEERDSQIAQILAGAEEIVKGLRQALTELKAADKPASTPASTKGGITDDAWSNSILPLGSFDNLVGVYA